MGSYTVFQNFDYFLSKFAFLFGIFEWYSKIIACACWAYVERILSHTVHTRNECYRWLSIRGMDFIPGWAYAEMFKCRKSRPNRIRFSKISCYRPLGNRVSVSAKKVEKKCHACVPLTLSCLPNRKAPALPFTVIGILKTPYVRVKGKKG